MKKIVTQTQNLILCIMFATYYLPDKSMCPEKGNSKNFRLRRFQCYKKMKIFLRLRRISSEFKSLFIRFKLCFSNLQPKNTLFTVNERLGLTTKNTPRLIN